MYYLLVVIVVVIIHLGYLNCKFVALTNKSAWLSDLDTK